METVKGIYHFEEKEHEAALSLLKDKLSIYLKENGRTIFWYYEHIRRENVYQFRYTEYPPQHLQVSTSSFADDLEQRLQKGKRRPNIGKATPLVKVLLGFVVFLVLIYFLVVPWIAGALANQFPVSYEKSIGDQAYNSMKTGYEIDKERTLLLNDFFERLHISSKYDVQITVVKGDILNAFAMPGGHIIVYDKLLNSLGTYPELAALLAHEFTHVENRHTVKTLFRRLGSKVFLSLILGDATAVGGIIISNADELKNLSYSRSLENEADENGVRLLADRYIECAGFTRLFTALKKETGSVQPSEWMSSHPDLNRRIKNVEENVFCKNARPQTDSALHHLFLKIKTAE